MSDYQLDEIKEHAGSAFIGDQSLVPGKDFVSVPGHDCLVCHQPKPEAYLLLDTLHRPKVQRLDVAIDVPASTALEAEAIEDRLLSLLVQRWRRPQAVNEVGHSWYSTKEPQGRTGYAAYDDKPDRNSEGPCAHVERRIIGCGPCHRAGFRKPSDVQNLDVVAWLKKHTVLKAVDLRMLGRQKLERNRAKVPNLRRWGSFTVDLDIRVGNALARWATATRDAAHRHEPVSALHVFDAFATEAWFDARTALRSVPLDSVLTITRP